MPRDGATAFGDLIGNLSVRRWLAPNASAKVGTSSPALSRRADDWLDEL